MIVDSVLVALLALLLLYPATLASFRVADYLRDKAEASGSLVIKACAVVAACVLLVLDVLFNATWGSILFKEWPREWLFSSRVKRHYRRSPRFFIVNINTNETTFKPRPETWRDGFAVAWAEYLNRVDPGHITYRPHD